MKKPIVLVIMDGVGRGDGGSGDAVKQANTPNLDKLMAVLPHDVAQGARHRRRSSHRRRHGQLRSRSQRARLRPDLLPGRKAGRRVRSKPARCSTSKTWKALIANCKDNGQSAAFSRSAFRRQRPFQHRPPDCDARRGAARKASKRVCCHILLDGRDVPATLGAGLCRCS